MVNISLGTAAITALLGYAVVFLGIVILMAVIAVMGNILKKKTSDEVIDLGSIKAPKGSNLKEVAAMAAVIAEMEREG